MLELTPKSTPEFAVGSKISILEHTGCSSTIGIIMKLNDLNKPTVVKCVNNRCTSRTVNIDWKQIEANRNAANRKQKPFLTFQTR